jgi:hypothetical protein
MRTDHFRFAHTDVMNNALQALAKEGLILALLLLTAGSATGQCPVRVPGTATLYLAGLPDGTSASAGAEEPPDVAPNQSPILASLVSLNAGQPLTFAASGSVSHCSFGSFCFSPSGPDGSGLTSHYGGAEHGISDIVAPYDALVGVFLGTERPDSSPAPAALDFSTPESLDYLTISPLLQQCFFIGDGRTSLGVTQQVVVPAGATRLFLGTVDWFGWANNYGSFSVTVSPSTNCHTESIRVSEVEFCWPSESDTLYRVEYSSALSSGWLPLFTNIVGTGQIMCIYDKIVRGQGQRFYRAVDQ